MEKVKNGIKNLIGKIKEGIAWVVAALVLVFIFLAIGAGAILISCGAVALVALLALALANLLGLSGGWAIALFVVLAFVFFARG